MVSEADQQDGLCEAILVQRLPSELHRLDTDVRLACAGWALDQGDSAAQDVPHGLLLRRVKLYLVGIGPLHLRIARPPSLTTAQAPLVQARDVDAGAAQVLRRRASVTLEKLTLEWASVQEVRVPQPLQHRPSCVVIAWALDHDVLCLNVEVGPTRCVEQRQAYTSMPLRHLRVHVNHDRIDRRVLQWLAVAAESEEDEQTPEDQVGASGEIHTPLPRLEADCNHGLARFRDRELVRAYTGEGEEPGALPMALVCHRWRLPEGFEEATHRFTQRRQQLLAQQEVVCGAIDLRLVGRPLFDAVRSQPLGRLQQLGHLRQKVHLRQVRRRLPCRCNVHGLPTDHGA
mmetsp:Transcript_79120/g.229818  ORF Transcript_79120/g.229818 Transcript_79120/m.229818 type:complete len:344 (-) Transcript_79120:530-1561(-)